MISPEDRKKMLKNFLKTSKVQVTFTKVNGDKRVMNCTLCEDFLPIDHNTVATPTKPIKENENVVRVFDLDKKEWRSFRLDSIIETKIL